MPNYKEEHPKEAAHFFDRLKERYDCDYKGSLYTQVCLKVVKGQTKLIKEESNNSQEIHMIYFTPRLNARSTKLYFVWCNKRGCVTTALPPENFDAEA